MSIERAFVAFQQVRSLLDDGEQSTHFEILKRRVYPHRERQALKSSRLSRFPQPPPSVS